MTKDTNDTKTFYGYDGAQVLEISEGIYDD